MSHVDFKKSQRSKLRVHPAHCVHVFMLDARPVYTPEFAGSLPDSELSPYPSGRGNNLLGS